MNFKLTYKGFKELIPISKIFLNKYLPFINIVKVLILIYLLLYITLKSKFSSIFITSDLIQFSVAFIILCMYNTIYSFVLFKKYNHRSVSIDFEKNSFTFQGKSPKAINLAKSKVLSENEILLVINVRLSFFNVGIPIFSASCKSEDFVQLKDYINGKL